MKIHAVGLLSPGDMGHVVGQVLIDHGMPLYTCLEGRSERPRLLARKARIRTVPTYEALIHETDVILSILVPAEAENDKIGLSIDNVQRYFHEKSPETP